jgi:hypothetical protein
MPYNTLLQYPSSAYITIYHATYTPVSVIMAQLFSKEAKAQLKAMERHVQTGQAVGSRLARRVEGCIRLGWVITTHTRWRGIVGRGGFGEGCSVGRGNWVGGVDGGKGIGLGKRGRSISGSMSWSMSGRVQRDLGSMVEGMIMGPGSADGRTTAVPETMAGEGSMLRPKVDNADEFGRTGGFRPRGLGSLTQSTGSGASKLGGQRLPRCGGGGL